jgi:hypothetical protein
MAVTKAGSARMFFAWFMPAATDWRKRASVVIASLLPTFLVGFSTSGRLSSGFGLPKRAWKTIMSFAWFASRLRSWALALCFGWC